MEGLKKNHWSHVDILSKQIKENDKKKRSKSKTWREKGIINNRITS